VTLKLEQMPLSEAVGRLAEAVDYRVRWEGDSLVILHPRFPLPDEAQRGQVFAQRPDWRFRYTQMERLLRVWALLDEEQRRTLGRMEWIPWPQLRPEVQVKVVELACSSKKPEEDRVWIERNFDANNSHLCLEILPYVWIIHRGEVRGKPLDLLKRYRRLLEFRITGGYPERVFQKALRHLPSGEELLGGNEPAKETPYLTVRTDDLYTISELVEQIQQQTPSKRWKLVIGKGVQGRKVFVTRGKYPAVSFLYWIAAATNLEIEASGLERHLVAARAINGTHVYNDLRRYLVQELSDKIGRYVPEERFQEARLPFGRDFLFSGQSIAWEDLPLKQRAYLLANCPELESIDPRATELLFQPAFNFTLRMAHKGSYDESGFSALIR